jgi:hypothetical protein
MEKKKAPRVPKPTEKTELSPVLKGSNRTEAKDKNFYADVEKSSFSNYLFVRLIAKGCKF